MPRLLCLQCVQGYFGRHTLRQRTSLCTGSSPAREPSRSPQAPAPLYAAFPLETRTAIDYKLRHASEFFAKVVLTFVIRDMALLLDKYVKKCEKWLAE